MSEESLSGLLSDNIVLLFGAVLLVVVILKACASCLIRKTVVDVGRLNRVGLDYLSDV